MPSLPFGRLGPRTVALLVCLAVVAVLLAISAHDPALGARLVEENDVVEWLQVVLAAAAGVLAFRQGRAARRAGRPATLEVAIVAAMVVICIGEVDLDRAIFGTKVISTRYFVHPRHSLPARALAFIVVVGAPSAVGVWLLVHVRNLWRASVDGLRQPWGQLAAFGIVLFAVVEVFEIPLGHITWLPLHFGEEVPELVSAICIFVGLLARQRAILRAGCPPDP